MRLFTSGMNHTCLYSSAAKCHRTLAGIYFRPAKGKGWVCLSGWSQTEVVYRPADGQPSTY